LHRKKECHCTVKAPSPVWVMVMLSRLLLSFFRLMTYCPVSEHGVVAAAAVAAIIASVTIISECVVFVFCIVPEPKRL